MPIRRTAHSFFRLIVTNPTIRAAIAAVWALAALMPASDALRGGDGPSGANGAGTAMIQTIQARIQRLKDDKDIDAEVRDELISDNNKAIELLRTADEFAAKAAGWTKTAETAAADLEKIRAELTKLTEQPAASTPVFDAKAGLAKMEQSLARIEAERDHRQQELDELSGESERRSDRRREIAERDEEIAVELREVQEALDRDPDEKDELAVLTRQSLLQARRRSLMQEEELHRQEILAYDATTDLVAAQRDLAATQLQAAEELLDAWQKFVNEARRSEANREYSEARQRVDVVHPALRPFAEANVELAAARRELAVRIEETIAESDAASERLDELRDQFEKVTERAKRIGFTEAIGLLLRKHRDALSVIDESLRNKRARADSVSQMNELLTEYEERRSQLADLNSRVRAEMTGVRSQMSEAETDAAQTDLKDLLQTQRRALDALIRDTTNYVDELMALETVERQLVACVREFADFSDAHILWIRSTGLPQRADIDRVVAAATWMLRPAHWQRAGETLAGDAWSHAGSYALIAVLLAGMGWLRRRLLGGAAGRLEGDHTPRRSEFRTALEELTLAVLSAAWWPSLAAFCGIRLSGSPQADEFTAALGRALPGLAVPWFMIGLLARIATRPEAAKCLLGSDDRQRASRRQPLALMSVTMVPLLLILLVAESQPGEGPRNTIGRLAFVLLMGACVLTARRWGFVPAAPLTAAEAGKAGFWRRRGTGVCGWLTVAAPLACAAASIAGYHYTAIQLARRGVASAGFLLGMVVLQTIIKQWARVSDAGLATDAAEQEAQTPPEPVLPVNGDAARVKSGGLPELLRMQVERLVGLGGFVIVLAGLLQIWSDVFPALTLLRSVELWPAPFRWIDPDLEAEEAARIVTAAGLLAALGIAIVTLAAARNVRGVLELTLFRHVGLDTGARYAVTAICRYAIALAGLFSACSQLGIGWEQLNWLVAAMTVGLGFGLQEIFANFVSGLILLFERPVRIGDIISVEGVTGTVSRIRIRATTITDGDMRELIVPNKELITGRVINWTLSNTVARMTVSVRTAHGVDPDKARNLLLSVASQHPLVLKQPAPQALFDEFSDKTQNFTLRVFMANCDVYPQLRHELLTSIQRTFRQNGIGLNSSDAASLPVPMPPQEQRAA